MSTFTNTKGALIEAAYDSGDETSLQALADVYEEEGDAARAKFVRLQGQLDGWPFRRWDNTPLLSQEQELLAQHGDRWLADLPRLPGVEYEFWRGLPRAVAEDGSVLRRHASVLAETSEV